MNVVMRVLEIPALIIGLFVLFYGIALIYNLVIGMFKKDFSKFKEYFNSFRSIANKYSLVYSGVFVVCILITIISSKSLLFLIGNRNLQLVPDGSYTYYVELTKISSGKTYTEPALIRKYDDNGFILERVYFANGGYITFDDTPQDLYIDEFVDVIDHKDNEYEVKLLNQHAYVKGVKESHPSLINYLILFTVLLFECCLWVFPIIKNKKDQERIDKINKLIPRLMEIWAKNMMEDTNKQSLKQFETDLINIENKKRKSWYEEDISTVFNKHNLKPFAIGKNTFILSGNSDFDFLKDLDFLCNALGRHFGLDEVGVAVLTEEQKERISKEYSALKKAKKSFEKCDDTEVKNEINKLCEKVWVIVK